MGMFGPSQSDYDSLERRLVAVDEARSGVIAERDAARQELAAAKAVVERLERELQGAHTDLVRANETADTDADTIAGLRTEVSRNQIANNVAQYVLSVLDEMESSGALEFLAETDARQITKERTVAQVTATLTNDLLEANGALYAAELDSTMSEKIREELDTRFQQDGSYERERAKVIRKFRTTIVLELLKAARAAAEADLQAPERQAELQEEVRQDAEFKGKLADVEAQARAAAEAVLQEQLIAEAPGRIAAEVEAGAEDALAKFIASWKETAEGKKMIAKLQKEVQERVEAMGREQIIATTESETLAALVTKRTEQIERQLEAETLLADFVDGGIDTRTIPAGARLEIILGDVISKREERGGYNSGRYQTSMCTINKIEEKRRLVLTSVGDGKFKLNFDSLAGSKSQFEQYLAIPVGTVLVLGHQQIEQGEKTLDNHIVCDVPLFYDTDTSDPAITPVILNVVAVKVNDTVAVRENISSIRRIDGSEETIERTVDQK